MIEYSGMIHIGWKQNKTVTNISIKKNIMQNIISLVKYGMLVASYTSTQKCYAKFIASRSYSSLLSRYGTLLTYWAIMMLQSVLRIRIHMIQFQIQHFRLNTVPIRIQGTDDQKLQKIYS